MMILGTVLLTKQCIFFLRFVLFPFLKDEGFSSPLSLMKNSDLRDQKTIGHHLSR